MARIRSLKPEFWADEKLAEACSRDARMLYLALWNLADEHSRVRIGPRYLKGQVFAYDDDITASTIAGLLKELDDAERIEPYEAGGEQYAFLPKLALHQRLEPGKSASRLPGPPTLRVVPGTDRTVGENSDESAPEPGLPAPRRESSGLSLGSGLGVEGQRAPDDSGEPAPTAGRRKPKRPVPSDWTPSEQLLAWGRDKFPQTEPGPEVPKFIDYHQARDNRFSDLNAAWRTWMTNAAKFAGARPTQAQVAASGYGWRG